MNKLDEIVVVAICVIMFTNGKDSMQYMSEGSKENQGQKEECTYVVWLQAIMLVRSFVVGERSSRHI